MILNHSLHFYVPVWFLVPTFPLSGLPHSIILFIMCMTIIRLDNKRGLAILSSCSAVRIPKVFHKFLLEIIMRKPLKWSLDNLGELVRDWRQEYKLFEQFVKKYLYTFILLMDHFGVSFFPLNCNNNNNNNNAFTFTLHEKNGFIWNAWKTFQRMLYYGDVSSHVSSHLLAFMRRVCASGTFIAESASLWSTMMSFFPFMNNIHIVYCCVGWNCIHWTYFLLHLKLKMAWWGFRGPFAK